MRIDRRHLLLTGAACLMPFHVYAQGKPTLTVYKDPSCGCCGAWADHMAKAGFPTKIVEDMRINARKTRLGIPQALWSCHTAEIGAYVIEGHVPALAVIDLLATMPDCRGLAVPGMPVGSPGMEVENVEPEIYAVMTFGAVPSAIFRRFRGTTAIQG
jgi:hypothetical protein